MRSLIRPISGPTKDPLISSVLTRLRLRGGARRGGPRGDSRIILVSRVVWGIPIGNPSVPGVVIVDCNRGCCSLFSAEIDNNVQWAKLTERYVGHDLPWCLLVMAMSVRLLLIFENTSTTRNIFEAFRIIARITHAYHQSSYSSQFLVDLSDYESPD